MKKVKGVLNKIRYRINYFATNLTGWIISKRLIKENPGKIIILSDRGVGDRVFMLAYLKKWAELYNINNWVILTSGSKNILHKIFSLEDDRLIILSEYAYQKMNLFCMSVLGCHFRMKHPEILYVNALNYFRGTKFLVNPCFFNYSLLTKAVYKIPQITEPIECVRWSLNKVHNILQKYEILKTKRWIFINPYANSCDHTPVSFFQKIADYFIEKGCSVLCSVIKDQKSLKGTRSISLPLDEAFAVCEACGTVIGARSGFMDLMAFTNARIICIDNRAYEYSDLFRLEDCWLRNRDIRTFYYNADNEDEEIIQIVDFALGEACR